MFNLGEVSLKKDMHKYIYISYRCINVEEGEIDLVESTTNCILVPSRQVSRKAFFVGNLMDCWRWPAMES